MAEKEKKEPYPHIKEHEVLYKKVLKLIQTTDLHHRQAYNKAIEDVITDEKGLIDYELLDKEENQIKLADCMADFYLSKAKQAFKSNIESNDEIETDRLMKAYAGVTKTELKRIIMDSGKNFTEQYFGQIKRQFMNNIERDLSRMPAEKINRPEYIQDIIKYTNLEDKVDSTKLNIEQATGILESYHQYGEVSKAQLENIKGLKYAMKDKDKKSEYQK